MKQLDLGCGNTLRGREGFEVYGVDIHDAHNPLIKVADLAIDPIPYDNDEFELVTAYDFMEHIPNSVYVPATNRSFDVEHDHGLLKWNCMIELFNEIYRVLKDGGEFYMVSPVYPSQGAFQDPTHVFFWTPETPNYFSGDYYGMHDLYGHTSKFIKVDSHVESERLHVTLRAVKPAGPPYVASAA